MPDHIGFERREKRNGRGIETAGEKKGGENEFFAVKWGEEKGKRGMGDM